MKTICKKKDCVGCTACKNSCPVNAINMTADSEGFSYPEISFEKCIDCGKCVKVCPANNNFTLNCDVFDIYAVQIQDKDNLKKSTSGGMFILLASYVLEKNGVVFGAKYDSNMVVKHCGAQTLEEVYPMQGSKYVQSDVGDTYRQVRDYLESGRYVLYSGTPCQIEGLKSYLAKPYNKLITMDLICGGVPSPLLFKLYIDDLEKKRQSKIIDHKFRDKTENGFSHTTVITENKNGNIIRTVIADRTKVSYYVAFGQQEYFRPSCYNCKYNNAAVHSSDFTCGGYFGSKEEALALGTYEGISEIIIHTVQGRRIFEEIKERIKYVSLTLDEALENNGMLNENLPENKRNPEMFNFLNSHGYEKTAKKYFPIYKQSFVKKIIPKSLKIKLKRFITHNK